MYSAKINAFLTPYSPDCQSSSNPLCGLPWVREAAASIPPSQTCCSCSCRYFHFCFLRAYYIRNPGVVTGNNTVDVAGNQKRGWRQSCIAATSNEFTQHSVRPSTKVSILCAFGPKSVCASRYQSTYPNPRKQLPTLLSLTPFFPSSRSRGPYCGRSSKDHRIVVSTGTSDFQGRLYNNTHV